jgi:uncharacterized protein (TIGR02246 family)
MKKKIKISVSVWAIPAIAAIFSSFTISLNHLGGDKEWVVPESAKKVKNPTKVTDENLKTGKLLFAKNCKSCHGPEGKGDGSKSKELNTPCGNFTEKSFQSQTDGTIFYKIREGRDDMPSFKKKISEEEDVWLIVNYLRTLAAPGSKEEVVKPKQKEEEKKGDTENAIVKNSKTETKNEKDKTVTENKGKEMTKQDSSVALEKSSIEQVVSKYEKAINASDTLAILTLYASDGIFMPSQAATAIGKDQIKASYKQLFTSFQFNVKFSVQETEQDGNVAFVRAISTEENTVLADKQKKSEENRELIFLKKINHEWKIYCYMFNKMSVTPSH